jgi:DNA primase
MTIGVEFLDLLKSRVSMISLVQAVVPLQRRGRDFWGLCPFHSEQSPSFMVNEAKASYHCFGCGAHGDAIKFLQETAHLSFVEAVETLASQVGMRLPVQSLQHASNANHMQWLYDLLELCTKWFQNQLLTSHGEKTRSYLSSRGVSKEEVQQFRLGWAPSGYLLGDFLKNKGYEPHQLSASGMIVKEKGTSFFADRLIFPICDSKNRVIAFGGRRLDDKQPKYLNSSESPVFFKKKALYGLSQDFHKKKGPLFLVEGYLDVIGVQRKFPALAPLGTAFSQEQCGQFLKFSQDIVICFDGDKAGKQATQKALKHFLGSITPDHRVRVIYLPLEQDPYLIMTNNPQQMNSLLEKSTHLSEALWNGVVEQYALETPEGQAQCYGAIREILSQIHNKDLQQSYRDFFFQKQRSIQHNKKWIQENRGSFSQKKHFSKDHKEKNSQKITNLPPVENQSLSKILLIFLLYYPDIIENVLEYLAQLIYQPHTLEENVLKLLLEWGESFFLSKDLALEKQIPAQEDLREYLRQHLKDFFLKKGGGHLWENLFYSSLLAGMEKTAESSKEALKRWHDLFEIHQITRNGMKDLSFIQDKTDPTNEENEQWEKICKIKESYLEKIYGI